MPAQQRAETSKRLMIKMRFIMNGPTIKVSDAGVSPRSLH